MPEPTTTPELDLAAQYDVGEESPVPSLGAGQPAPADESSPALAPSPPAINAAGRPYDPTTGRLLPADSAPLPEPEAPAVPTLPERPSYLVRMAEHFGIDTEGRSEEALAAAVEANQRLLARMQEGEGRRADITRAAQPQVTSPQPHPLSDDLGLTAEELDELHPAIQGVLKKVLKPILSRQRELEQRLGQLDQGFRSTVSETNTERLDRALLALNDPRIGKLRRHELSDDAPEVARRTALVSQAIKMAGDKGSSVHAVCGKIKAAHEFLFGAIPEPAVAPKPPASDRWAQGGVQRPTQRKGAQEPNGVAKAVQAVTELQREMGGEPDSIEDFPG